MSSQPQNSDAPRHRYDARFANAIETRWQNTWLGNEVFRVPNPGDKDFDATRPKFYCLDMFPYPSGAGLHIGHPEGYTATDIVSRYKRMKGFNVLHPMGWDAFGLPAEQYAIQTGVHPAITTKKAIDNFRRQLQRFGFSYDWSREYGTIDPEYYKWTQWIFLQLYNAWFEETCSPTVREDLGRARPISELEQEFAAAKRPIRFNPRADEVPETDRAKTFSNWPTLDPQLRRRILDSYRLAYQSTTTVNWCPKLGTVLANDEVIDGKSERGGYPVLRKPLKQWMFRITAYNERLLQQLDELEWVESTKTMQREWIGRSEGAEIDFQVHWLSEPIPTSSTPPSSHPADSNPVFSAKSKLFVPRNPFPPGEPSPTELMVQIKNLPHLELPEATYFVTWRTDGWRLNAAGQDIVMKALMHFDGDRCDVFAACVMDTHVHWLVKPRPGHALKDLVASVKRFSATQVNKLETMSGSLWQHEHFDHIVRDERWLGAFVKYIARNAVEAKLVGEVSAYKWAYVASNVTKLDGSSLAVGASVDWHSVPIPAASTPCSSHQSGSNRPPSSIVQERMSKVAGGRVEEVGIGSESQSTTLRVFTTRPDTLFGATYMVVAPEHPLCKAILDGNVHVEAATRDALRTYVTAAKNRSDVERQESKEKTGVFTGLYAINPATNQNIPIWTADYVLMGYGTGAIMAVPAHDERDFEFAVKHRLDIIQVVLHNLDELSPMDGVTAVHADIAESRPRIWIRELTDAETARTLFDSPTGASFALRSNPNDKQAWISFEYGSMQEMFGALQGPRDRVPTPANVTVGYDPLTKATPEPGFACNSSNPELSFNGLPTSEAKQKITTWLEQKQIGYRKINYKLRDWTFSRQRYWGEPFPIVFDDAGNAYPIEPSHLPVKLPELADYAPVESDDPQPLLAKAKDWVRTTAGAAGVSPALLDPNTPVTRETNTMPGSAGSSWYAIRYCDAKNSERLVGEEAEAYWMGGSGGGLALRANTYPSYKASSFTNDDISEAEAMKEGKALARSANLPGIDLYLGGSEHAVGHLLYSRFWQNVLFDLGHVTCKEPFRKLFHQGLITSFAYQRPDKSIVPVDEVKEVVEGQPEKGYIEIATGQAVSPIITKMSKRYKNVINPDDVINEFGADTCRLYEMYMGPLDASKPWNPRDIIGCFRFLQRAWRMCVDEETGKLKLSADAAGSPGLESRGTQHAQTEKLLHRLIKKVGDDIERLSFNTAIAAMIEFVNAAGASPITRSQMERFILTLAPFAPHLAEEIWSKLGFPAGTREHGVLSQPWPTFDAAMLVDDEIELPISVMGKVRARITVSTNIAKDAKALEAAAMADTKVQELIAGKEVKKVIVVPGKMVNLVLG